MPELPEVETTVSGLKKLINKEITKIRIYSTKLRYNIPKNITKILKTNKFTKIYRIGKYIIADLSDNYCIVFHLGMSGRLRIVDKIKYKKTSHDHIVIQFKNSILIFNDVRKFGFVDLCFKNQLKNKKYMKILGLDAFDKNLNQEYLKIKLNKSIVPIKQILLNQKIIAGIGNIYASEILYDAKISPLTKGGDLSYSLRLKLIKSIKKILTKAIKSGGSTLRDYTSADGTLGNFQNNFKVYSKKNKTVLGHKIKKIIQYGRSTYYCPKLQKKIT